MEGSESTPLATSSGEELPGGTASFRWVGRDPPPSPTTPAFRIRSRRSALDSFSHSRRGAHLSRRLELAAELDGHGRAGLSPGKTQLADLGDHAGDRCMHARRPRAVRLADEHAFLHAVAGPDETDGRLAGMLEQRDQGARGYHRVRDRVPGGTRSSVGGSTPPLGSFVGCVMGPGFVAQAHLSAQARPSSRARSADRGRTTPRRRAARRLPARNHPAGPLPSRRGSPRPVPGRSASSRCSPAPHGASRSPATPHRTP